MNFENHRFLEDLIIAAITSIATGYFVYIAGVKTSLRLAKRKALQIRKRFQLHPGVTSLEQVTFQYDTQDFKSHLLNLIAYNGSEFSIHNVMAYLTINYRPEDRSWSGSPRLFDEGEPPQPAIRQPLWWKTGNRCALYADIRPGETVEIMFMRFKDFRSNTKSPPYIDNDLILRTITVGITPENETPIIELQRKRKYELILTLVSDEAQPMCYRIEVDPTKIFESTSVAPIPRMEFEKREQAILSEWQSTGPIRAELHINQQLGKE